jgi:hypothetical protein
MKSKRGKQEKTEDMDAVDLPELPDSYGLAPPPVTVKASPLENGVAVYAPMAPATAGTDDKPTSQLNLDLFLTNTGQTELQLSDFLMAYIPPPLVLVANVTVNQLVANNLLEDPTIAPGETRKLMVPAGQLPYLAPRAINIALSFEGYPGAVEMNLPLAPHVSCPSGAYRFPFRLSDLAEGEYWCGEIPGLADGKPYPKHRRSSSQRFAYDLKVTKWDPDLGRLRITVPGSSGNTNEDYLAWGKPIYAMAAGTVLSCGRDIPDNPNPPDAITFKGGNVIWIQHNNGEVSMYGHIMQYSSPEYLCNPGYEVCENEFLGLVGNSGSSTWPHLHCHVQRGQPNDIPHASGRPLLFRGIHTLPAHVFRAGDTNAPWVYLDGHGLRAFPQIPQTDFTSRLSLIWPAPFPPRST